MNPLVKQLKERLLLEFEKIAERIRCEIQEVQVKVEHRFFERQEVHAYILNCSFGYFDEDIDLSVSLFLQKIPRINADVCWATGYIEAEFYENYQSSAGFPEATDEILEELYKDLPRLYEALFEGLKRRKPADE